MKDILKLLYDELKPYKKLILVCSALALCAAGLDTFGPIVMGRGFDLAKGRAPFLWYGGALLAWFAVQRLSQGLRTIITRNGASIAHRVRETYYNRLLIGLLKKPLSFHHGKKGAEMSSKLSRVQWQIANVIEGAVFDFTPAVLAMFAILTYLFFKDWQIAAALAATIAAYVLYTWKTAPIWLEKQKQWEDVQRKASSVGWDAMTNILVVKSTTNEPLIARVIDKHRQEFEAVDDGLNRFTAMTFYWQDVIFGLGTLAVLTLALRRFSAGLFTFGLMTALTAYAYQIFGYLRFVQWQFRNLLMLATSYRAVKELAAEPDEDYESGKSAELKGAVEFRNVRFRYREDKPTLEDVSFAVKPGERIAVVGESGEGKTTLVDLIGRYYEPQSGRILLDGKDLGGINRPSLRDQMALVPQEHTLFHETIGFNIRFGRPDATDEQVREAARLAALEEFIEALPEKYGTIVGERGLKLSGGERQRVTLARAFIRDPKILILDEPTSNLDSKTETIIQQSLERLMRGRTTFIIAHRMRTIREADRILVLKDGRIVEAGTHEELAGKPDGAYRALLKAQSEFISLDEPHLGTETAA